MTSRSLQDAAVETLGALAQARPELVRPSGPGGGLSPAGVELLKALLIVAAAQTSQGPDDPPSPPAQRCFHWLSQLALEALMLTIAEAQRVDVSTRLRDLGRWTRDINRRVGEAVRPVGPTGHRTNGNRRNRS